ncbi:MAG: response regulator transcription factor [Bdellovibrionales bacterium]|nr:response regulator transcription factor [Bdellovibrionales bacterium]
MNRILVIDDDEDFQDYVKGVLESDYHISTASCGRSGIETARDLSPDLILVDLVMPEMNGIEVCKVLRQDARTRWIPLIMVTVADDDERLSEALRSGADDLVSKPFRHKELKARIALRMQAPNDRGHVDEVLRCGNLVLNVAKFEARIDDKPVSLTVLEFKLLKYFVQNRERLLSRDKILNAIWDREVSERVVDNHILSLRKKLQDSHYTLTSVYGGGYILKPRDMA